MVFMLNNNKIEEPKMLVTLRTQKKHLRSLAPPSTTVFRPHNPRF